MKKGTVAALWICMAFFLLLPVKVLAAEAGEENAYTEELLEELDFSGVDAFIEESLPFGQRNKVSFSDIVDALLEDGAGGFDYTMLLSWVKDMFFFEIEENRKLLLEVVLFAVGFSILRNFSVAFRSSYVSDLCFMLVYCVLAVLLLQSFLVFREIVTEVLKRSVDFMRAFVPAFCVTMVFSSGAGTSAGFYQIAFLVIYLIQWLFLKVLMPCIHIYVMMELFNHFFEDEKFQNLTELLKGFVCWGMKLAGGIVLGLNVVQGLITPAKDRLINDAVTRTAGAIPGIGNIMNGVSEVLLGSGIVIKNCVGVAALVVLLLIGLLPVLKIFCMAFFYKISAALTEPVTDKRISGCLKGMAEGGILYLKLLIYCLALFLLTIALTTAVSSFMI